MTEARKAKLKDKILEELRHNPIVEPACLKVGLARSTFYRWQGESSTFELEVDIARAQGRERVNDMAESVVFKGIKAEDQRYVLFWLKHNHRNYVEKKTLKPPFEREHSTEWGTINDKY